MDGEDITIDPSSYTGAQASPEINSISVFSPAEVLILNGGILTIAANLSAEDDVETIGPGSGILSDQPAGIYLLQLVSESSVSSHKVVKRK